jgi:hypothetical protein
MVRRFPPARAIFLGGPGLRWREYVPDPRLSPLGWTVTAVWPLTQASQACFGSPDWPAARRVPQVSIEFEVADADAVQSAADELRARGFELLHDARTEPWGQTVARLQSIEGCIVGISYAPWMHDGD